MYLPEDKFTLSLLKNIILVGEKEDNKSSCLSAGELIVTSKIVARKKL